MARIIEITDLDRPELDVFARLTEGQLRSRRDEEKGIFIGETAKVIGYAMDAGCRPLAFLMERRALAGPGAELIDRCGDVPVYTGESSVLAALTGYALTRGVLAALTRPKQPPAEAVTAGARRIAIFEGLVDPANLGAAFRSAAALGVDGVLLAPNCCDPLYRRAVRVSMGTVFKVPWARMDRPWPESAFALLRKAGFAAAALALDDRAVPLDDPALGAEEKLALFLGSEGDGLLPQTVAGCNYCVRIPMGNGVDSLNVAAASAVAFWQLRVK